MTGTTSTGATTNDTTANATTANDTTARLSRVEPAPSGTAWAWSGALGGVVGVVGLIATGDLYDVATGAVADNTALAAAVAERASLV